MSNRFESIRNIKSVRHLGFRIYKILYILLWRMIFILSITMRLRFAIELELVIHSEYSYSMSIPSLSMILILIHLHNLILNIMLSDMAERQCNWIIMF